MKMMKWINSLVCAITVIGVSSCSNKSFGGSILEDVYVAPVGVYKIPNIHDTGEWGAGLELGMKLNKSVSLGLLNTSYAGDNLWKEDSGILVDETSAIVHADLFSNANKTLTLVGVGSGNRDWNAQDWGFGVGLGIRAQLSKSISLGVESQIRAWFKQDKDLFNTASIKWEF
jgi:hypothetical protein